MDILARFGGDEFVSLLPEIKDYKDSILVAEKILTSLQIPWVIQEHTFINTSSIGIAHYDEENEDYKSLLKRADLALYEAKVSGKNVFKIASHRKSTILQ